MLLQRLFAFGSSPSQTLTQMITTVTSSDRISSIGPDAARSVPSALPLGALLNLLPLIGQKRRAAIG
ncbi:hypothetical protein INR49_013993 [Caranx melampygus]|nr:hypothetical protein INR49_013993 [Caranx melampygus]